MITTCGAIAVYSSRNIRIGSATPARTRSTGGQRDVPRAAVERDDRLAPPGSPVQSACDRADRGDRRRASFRTASPGPGGAGLRTRGPERQQVLDEDRAPRRHRRDRGAFGGGAVAARRAHPAPARRRGTPARHEPAEPPPGSESRRRSGKGPRGHPGVARTTDAPPSDPPPLGRRGAPDPREEAAGRDQALAGPGRPVARGPAPAPRPGTPPPLGA